MHAHFAPEITLWDHVVRSRCEIGAKRSRCEITLQYNFKKLLCRLDLTIRSLHEFDFNCLFIPACWQICQSHVKLARSTASWLPKSWTWKITCYGKKSQTLQNHRWYSKVSTSYSMKHTTRKMLRKTVERDRSGPLFLVPLFACFSVRFQFYLFPSSNLRTNSLGVKYPNAKWIIFLL